jgi:hypothetical protein
MNTAELLDFIAVEILLADEFRKAEGLRVTEGSCCQSREVVAVEAASLKLETCDIPILIQCSVCGKETER